MKDLSTLAAAVSAAGLLDALGGQGPFTVFAPVNSAFDALPPGFVDDLLLPRNRAKLGEILTYHVVSGKVMAADLAGKRTVATALNGARIVVDATGAGGGVLVNGTPVLTADVKASNGVIHLIGAVLTLPPSVPEPLTASKRAEANFVGKGDGNDGALRSLFRVLWAKHAAQTREVIIATLDKNEQSAPAALEDLLRNQREIGGSVGAAVDNERVGATFTRELQSHIQGAGQILAALMQTNLRVSDYMDAIGLDDTVRLSFPKAARGADPTAALLGAIDDWYENGEVIVSLVGSSLSGLSRKKKEQLASAFNQHLYHTIVEGVLYYAGEFDASLRWAHAASSHLMTVSDFVTNSLIEELGGARIGLRLSGPLKRVEQFLQRIGSFDVPNPKEVARISSIGGGGGGERTRETSKPDTGRASVRRSRK